MIAPLKTKCIFLNHDISKTKKDIKKISTDSRSVSKRLQNIKNKESLRD